MVGYKKASPTAAREGLDEVRSGVPFLKLEPGKKGKSKKTWIRAMPPRADHPNDRFYLWVKVHFGVGQNNRSLQCLLPDDRFCPVCAEVERLKTEGYPKESDAMRGKWRALLNVVQFDDHGAIVDDEVKVWSIGRDLLTDLLDEADALDEDENDISDPETGRDISVGRKGTGRNDTRYTVEVADEASQFNEGDFDLLEELPDLTQVYQKMEPANAQRLLTSGQVDPWADEDDVVEGEVREVEAPVGRKAGRVRDLPKDDEDEEEDDLPLDPPAPGRAKKTRTSGSASSTAARSPAKKTSSKRTSEPSAVTEPEEEAAPPRRAPARSSHRPQDDAAAARERLRQTLAEDEDDEEEDDEDD